MAAERDQRPSFAGEFPPDMPHPQHRMVRILTALQSVFVDTPVDFVRDVMTKHHDAYPYYHRRYRRVPTIDECAINDYMCRFEARIQTTRDKQVETFLLGILRRRFEICQDKYVDISREDESYNPCREIYATYEAAMKNYGIKWGDVPWYAGPEDLLMKQKHRLVWERRHGPITTTTNPKYTDGKYGVGEIPF